MSSTSKKINYLFYISQNYSFAILRPLQTLIIQQGDDVCWFLEGKSVNENHLKQNEKRLLSVNEIMIYQPDIIFYPANIAPTFLPGLNVAIFHGFDAGKLDKKGHNDHYKVRHCFDLYCTQGPESTQEFNKLAKLHPTFNVVETGWCALDPLFNQQPTENINKSKPTILLCSTFSKKLSCAKHVFAEVKKLTRTYDWQWLIQFHPKMDEQTVAQYKSLEGDNVKYIETDNVLPLLQQADVMVCDTSSVLLMFLLLRKPVVTFRNIDPKPYLLNINEVDELAGNIELALTNPPKLMSEIDTFIQKTHPYTDGKSAQRVLDAVKKLLTGELQSVKTKKMDVIRQFKMRKKLNYWKFW